MNISIAAIAAPHEIPYLKEWTSYHFDLGFDRIYLGLNDWTNEDMAFVKCTDFGGWVNFFNINGPKMQMTAYNMVLDRSPREAVDWLMLLDIDEFLKIRSERDIKTILKDHSELPSLALNWRLFGSNGLEDVVDGDYSIKRFTRCSKSLNQHVKQFVNVDLCRRYGIPVKSVNPHFLNIISGNQEHQIVRGPFNRTRLDEVHELEISHYVTKSHQECLKRRKFRRADCGVPREDAEDFFKEHDINEVHEDQLFWIPSN